MTDAKSTVTLNVSKDLDSGVKFPLDFSIEYPTGQGMAAIAALGEQMTDPLIEMFADIAYNDHEDRSITAFEDDGIMTPATPENVTGERHEVKFGANMTLTSGITVPVGFTFSYPEHHALTTVAMIAMLPGQQRHVAQIIATESYDGSIVNAMNAAGVAVS
ncbi:hypothetical protein [Aeromicrobium sp. 179-A 4D2 NHS]|uniref:hypothetical protein n=1 Tax=Aeromicrobium sp. 179-A 4D2 NHS TaxID=3142375 RepID=UPI00399F91E8